MARGNKSSYTNTSGPRLSWRLLACFAAAIAIGCGADTTESSATHANAMITVVGPADSLRIGQSYQMTARDSAGRPIPVTWSSSAPGVAAVSDSGVVTAFEPGAATVSATAISGGAQGETFVYVGVFPRVGILPAGQFGDTMQLVTGQPLQLIPAEYHGAMVVVPTRIAWSSSDASIATVDAAGLLTGVAPGVATITATIDQRPATRFIRVVPTSGTATIRMIDADADYATVTMRPNLGTAATLTFGATSEQVVPAAGTLQLLFDEAARLPQLFYNNSDYYEWQVFAGFLPAGAHETFIAVRNPGFGGVTDTLAIARLDDRATAVPVDSAAVRVLDATSSPLYYPYNVFFTDHPDGAVTLEVLEECHLCGPSGFTEADGPYAFTDYVGRTPGDFDIVLQEWNGAEASRFHVTALAGHATTFILTRVSKTPTVFRILSVTDR